VAAATKTTAAAKKPAAKKKAPIPESESAPQFQVIDQVFVWHLEDQDDIRIPLRIKMKLLRELVRIEKEEDASDMEQLFVLLDALGDHKSIEQIDEMFIEDATPLIEAYFDEFAAHNKATPGE